MRTVNIAELKDRLSAYIAYVKSGETVLIRDRNTPVARLVPFASDDATDEELELIAAGVLRPAERSWDEAAITEICDMESTGESDYFVQALLQE